MVDFSAIRDGTDVISSDGERVGSVAGLENGRIGVRGPGGATHEVDGNRVSRIDEHVHLLDSAGLLRRQWSGAPPVKPEPGEGRANGPWIVGLVFLAILLFLLIWGLVYMFGGTGSEGTGPSEPEQSEPVR